MQTRRDANRPTPLAGRIAGRARTAAGSFWRSQRAQVDLWEGYLQRQRPWDAGRLRWTRRLRLVGSYLPGADGEAGSEQPPVHAG